MSEDDAMPVSRERILQAAVRLFAERGLEGATLADIAEEAHLSKATLYHHFPDGKASIFHDAIEGVIERAYTQVEEHVRSLPDPITQLETYVRLRIEAFDAAMQAWGLARHTWDDMKPWAEATLESYFDRERALLEELFAKGRAAGVIRDVEPAVATKILQALLRGLTVDGPIETRAPERDVETEAVLDVFRLAFEVEPELSSSD